ncbi:TonB-dependent receptor plug domain-containing protein [Azospira restricta]|uniref:TonB-dependent receptor n=1 Tax=Azospira restricta TaxID=404405 RepID=A0A974SQV8_9RHOO|nr:TonB-dependent receptor [Azospira restricta]QRJ64762.1 TonB-dependent receptor [Azospira restricta]
MKHIGYRTLALASALALQAPNAMAQLAEEEDLAMAYGDKSFVTIATGSRVPVHRAPAVATVITAEDIAAIGASDLDEVLETVPGLHVARSTQTNGPIYVIRGVHRDANPQVLMLENGIPLSSVFSGNRGNVWGGMPVDNIARIEVIRGPGSAAYGADAFAGVINIITKTAADIGGTEIGVRAGNFKTGDAWVLHGGKRGGLEVAAYFRAGTTDGQRRTVRADAQSGWDRTAGTSASHAPGPIDVGRKAIDGQLDLAYDKWRFRVGYKERDNVGSGTGVASALDPTGSSYSQRITSDLTYLNKDFARHWEVTAQASFMHYKEFSDLTLFPAGFRFTPVSPVFTDGMIGNPYKWERHGRFNASAFYTGIADHRIRLGAGTEKAEIYKTRESKNFNPDFSPIGTGSVADVTDVSDTAPFLRPHSRIVRYAFVQDEWSFAKDWTLTAGLRHDRYDDFGGTTNPRLALAWEAAYNLTAKVLYGTAFRAPSFTEKFNINNPVQIGNPNLKPERMKTLEAAVSWLPTERMQLSVNVFHYEMRDIIQLVGTTYNNTGEQKGRGLEFEAAWDATKNLRLAGNYSLQRSTDEASGEDAGLAPRHRVYLRADWRFTPGWQANAQVNWVADRKRAAGDTRPEIDDYATVDLTVRTLRGRDKWDIAVSVRNLFNADAREPSPWGMPFVALPYDFPLPGRTFLAQAGYRF